MNQSTGCSNLFLDLIQRKESSKLCSFDDYFKLAILSRPVFEVRREKHLGVKMNRTIAELSAT